MLSRALAAALVATALAGGALLAPATAATPAGSRTPSTSSATSTINSTANSTTAGTTAGYRATTRLHFITNRDGSTRPKRWGFNVFDTGPSLATIRSLPRGVKALVWLGQKCPTPPGATFKQQVRKLAASPRVLGYYLSDEPHVSDCPGGPAAVRSRADFIRNYTGDRQKSFIVLDKHDGSYADYTAFRPAVTRVSMVGLDAYPCNRTRTTCDFGKINERVRAAQARNISLRKVVPVYQAFGQGRTSDPYYRLPTPAEARTIVHRWATLVPNPPMDYTYSWGHQSSANPTLVDSYRLKVTFRDLFAS